MGRRLACRAFGTIAGEANVKRLGWAMSAALMAAAGQAGAAEQVVRIADNAYEPASLQARVGDTMRFVNEDADWHEVFVPTAGFALDLGKQEQGTETTLTLTRPGIFEVECVHHLPMLLTVQVEP
jgi:plastocyanin